MLYQSYFSKKLCFTLYRSTSKLLGPPLPVGTTRVEAGELDRAAWGNWPVSISTPRWRLERLRALLEATDLWAYPHHGGGWRGWGHYWRQLTCEHIHTTVEAGEVEGATGGNWPVSISTPRWRLERLRGYWRQLTCEHIHTTVEAGEFEGATGGNRPVSMSTRGWRLERLRALLENSTSRLRTASKWSPLLAKGLHP
jgi:hypothetical protein